LHAASRNSPPCDRASLRRRRGFPDGRSASRSTSNRTASETASTRPPTSGPIAWDTLNPGFGFGPIRECDSSPLIDNLTSNDDWADLRDAFRDQPGALINDLADACREAPGSQFPDANGNGFADVCEADMNRLQAFPAQLNGSGSGGGASGGSGPVTDHTPPVLSNLSAKPSVVRLARAHHKARNARLRFTVSEPSLVTFTAELVLLGRRSGKHCIAGRRHGKACTAYKKIAGSLRCDATSGKNTVMFSGRLSTRMLKPGRCRLTAIAIDTSGNISNPARVTITVR
jgi:hypothetical protein